MLGQHYHNVEARAKLSEKERGKKTHTQTDRQRQTQTDTDRHRQTDREQTASQAGRQADRQTDIHNHLFSPYTSHRSSLSMMVCAGTYDIQDIQATLSHECLSYVPFTISCLFPAFPIPSSPFFCDFCKKLTCGVIRSFNYYFHSTSSTYLPTSLPTYLSTYPPTYLPTYLPMYLPIYLYLSTHLPPEHHIFITINILILKAEKSI